MQKESKVAKEPFDKSLAVELKTGIIDTAGNNEMIAKNLLEAAKSVVPGKTEVISYIEGPNGKVQLVSRWKILDDGTAYLATVILKPIK